MPLPFLVAAGKATGNAANYMNGAASHAVAPSVKTGAHDSAAGAVALAKETFKYIAGCAGIMCGGALLITCSDMCMGGGATAAARELRDPLDLKDKKWLGPVVKGGGPNANAQGGLPGQMGAQGQTAATPLLRPGAPGAAGNGSFAPSGAGGMSQRPAGGSMQAPQAVRMGAPGSGQSRPAPSAQPSSRPAPSQQRR